MTHFFKLKKALGIGAPKFEDNTQHIPAYSEGGVITSGEEKAKEEHEAKMKALKELMEKHVK